MHDEIKKYTQKLIRDRTATPESIHFYRLDDVVTTNREDEWLPVFTEVFSSLNITALLFARLTLPFADLLVERADPKAVRLVPNDSETRVFLHDIPFIRNSKWEGKPKTELAPMIIRCLKERKAVIIQGLGVVATGGVTVEQAFIGFSTIFHTTFVKYLLDLLVEGFRLPDEQVQFEVFKKAWGRSPELSDLTFAKGPLECIADFGFRIADCEREKSGQQIIYNEICRVGRYTVEKGYVDSFFGNISYFDGKTIFISQTTSSLDELEGHIDPVPLDNSSTAGLSASSELPAHRGVYLASNYHAVLHGHPRFSIVMSMFCEEENCGIDDCNRLCNRKRSVCGVPIVAGETGAGGLAKSVPLALKESGVCIAFGHGIFAAGEKDFEAAFMRMAEVENQCREAYFKLMESAQRRMKTPHPSLSPRGRG
jgi:ribulose-5-phosphate 4-epimerase/fuculose-1-phosphate aldolase